MQSLAQTFTISMHFLFSFSLSLVGGTLAQMLEGKIELWKQPLTEQKRPIKGSQFERQQEMQLTMFTAVTERRRRGDQYCEYKAVKTVSSLFLLSCFYCICIVSCLSCVLKCTFLYMHVRFLNASKMLKLILSFISKEQMHLIS